MSSAPLKKPDSDFVAREAPGERRPWSREIVLIIAVCVVVPLVIAFGFGNQAEMQVCAVIVGAAGLAVGLAHPFLGLIFFVALLYVRPEENIAVLRGMHFTLIAAAVASLSVIFQKLMDREAPIKFPVNGLIVGFGAVMVVSTLNRSGMGSALQDSVRLVALVLMIVNLARTPDRYRALSTAVIVFTMYLAGFSIFRYYEGIAFNRNGLAQAQATGIFSDPNDLSATIVAGLGLALCRAIAERGTQRLFYSASILVMVWAVYLTNSRGGMLAMAATIAACALIYSRSRWVAVALVVVLCGAAIKFGPSRMHDLDTSEESANSRFHFWLNGTAHFVSDPARGIGYGQFAGINNGFTAHNSFVLCYTELGLPGYICWMGCLFYSFRGLYRKKEQPLEAVPAARPRSGRRAREPAKSAPQPPRSAAWHDGVGARLALAGFLIAAFFISRTYVPVLYLLISLPLAQQIAYSEGRTDFSLTPKEKWRDACSIVALCLVSIVIIFVIAWKLKG